MTKTFSHWVSEPGGDGSAPEESSAWGLGEKNNSDRTVAEVRDLIFLKDKISLLQQEHTVILLKLMSETCGHHNHFS